MGPTTWQPEWFLEILGSKYLLTKEKKKRSLFHLNVMIHEADHSRGR